MLMPMVCTLVDAARLGIKWTDGSPAMNGLDDLRGDQVKDAFCCARLISR